MSLFQRFRGGKESATAPAVSLPEVVGELQQAAIGLLPRPLDEELLLARLADGLRRHGLAPPPVAETAGLTATLDEDGRQRAALLGALLDGAAMSAVWPALGPGGQGGPIIARGILPVARKKRLLTLELVRQSELRAEELARALLAELGAAIVGESAKVSQQQLAELDYERLLSQADQARREAEKRLEELRKLQDQSPGGRRGKW